MAYGKFGRKRARSAFRKKKAYGKKRVFKRRTKSMGARLKTVEKKVRRMKPENKYRFVEGSSGQFTQVIGADPVKSGSFGWFGTEIGIGHIDQGTEKDERIGNQLIRKSYSIRFQVVVTPHQAIEAAPLMPNRYLRCMVVQTKENIEQFASGDWLINDLDAVTNRVFSPVNPDRLKGGSIHILYDRVHKYSKNQWWYNAGVAPYGGQTSAPYRFTCAVRPTLTMCYDNNMGTSILTPIYVLFFDDLDNINIAPQVSITSYIERWQDNC